MWRHRVRVLVRVQAHRDIELWRAIGRQAAQLIADRDVTSRRVDGHGRAPTADDPLSGTGRAVIASPCAGRSSASANATTCDASDASASASYSTTCMPLRYVCTVSPPACRAQPPVG